MMLSTSSKYDSMKYDSVPQSMRLSVYSRLTAMKETYATSGGLYEIPYEIRAMYGLALLECWDYETLTRAQPAVLKPLLSYWLVCLK